MQKKGVRQTQAPRRKGSVADGVNLLRLPDFRFREAVEALATAVMRARIGHTSASHPNVRPHLGNTPAYGRSWHRRKKVEMLFAHLKRILRLGRLRLRGPRGARDEFLLAATAQNLRKLAKLRPMTVFA